MLSLVCCATLLAMPVASGQTGKSNPSAAPPPIPELDEWEDQMVRYGKKWGPSMHPVKVPADERHLNAYYDALYIYLRIMDYTGDQEPWLSYAAWARNAWVEERYQRPQYNMSGYHRFSLGMLEDYQRDNITLKAAEPVAGITPLTIKDMESIRDLGAFGLPQQFAGIYCGSCSNMSRELAYGLVATVVSERAGVPRVMHNAFNTGEEPRLQTYVRWAGRHMEQWRFATYKERGYQPDESMHYMQPFMAGITMKALIDFYEWETENGRDPNAYWEDPTADSSWPTLIAALADFADWLYSDARVRDVGGTPSRYIGKQLWDKSAGGFRYADRYTPQEGETPDVVSAAPDLNLLIAPVYAWLYKETGEDRFRIEGDDIFAQGVRKASPDWGSKQFNQQYFYGFDYVRWRGGK